MPAPRSALPLAALLVGLTIGALGIGAAFRGEAAVDGANGAGADRETNGGDAADFAAGGAAPAPVPAPMQGATAPAADGAAPPAGRPAARLELPDGTFVDALNGATGVLALQRAWGSRPWSPILRVERSDAGVDWYVHEDGTRSTTVMKWRPDLGREDALVRVAIPRDSAPPVRGGR